MHEAQVRHQKEFLRSIGVPDLSPEEIGEKTAAFRKRSGATFVSGRAPSHRGIQQSRSRKDLLRQGVIRPTVPRLAASFNIWDKKPPSSRRTSSPVSRRTSPDTEAVVVTTPHREPPSPLREQIRVRPSRRRTMRRSESLRSRWPCSAFWVAKEVMKQRPSGRTQRPWSSRQRRRQHRR